MRQPRRPRAVVIAASLVLAAPTLTSCSVEGLALEQDHRIEFVEPDYREKVTLPFTIRWSIEDFEITGPTSESQIDAGYIEVLFDREPQPPGQGVGYFARDDISCRPDDGCPDRRYLAQRQIFTTTNNYFTVTALPPAPGVQLDRGQADIHDIVLVLLDGQGRRIGESAWWNVFEIIHDND